MPHADVVMPGTRCVLPDGRACWWLYDCAKNAWAALRLAGQDPLGRRREAEHNVSLGLSYDPRRKLVWAADARMTIHVLRMDMAAADILPGADLPAAGKGS